MTLTICAKFLRTALIFFAKGAAGVRSATGRRRSICGSALPLVLLGASIIDAHSQTVVGIIGSRFTINGHPTYTASGGFPSADPSIEGSLLNVRAVQGIFDDANYPSLGSRQHPYRSRMGDQIAFDYPNGSFCASRNLNEFLAALPDWRRAGTLAFTVNLQGGGPTDGNFGVHDQPQWNSGFDSHGNLKPAYAERLRQVIERADQLGMVVIVGFFYQGSAHWVDMASDDRYARVAIIQASQFLKGLSNRNILIEIANEVDPSTYEHPILQPDGIIDAVRLAQETVQHQIPVSFSLYGSPPDPRSREYLAMKSIDYILIHTNGRTPEGVDRYIQRIRASAGNDRPLLINEDGASVFNLIAATDENVGWGYYDQGLNNYRDGFQSPPVNWRINTNAKWVFFDQVARLTGSTSPPLPIDNDATLPRIHIKGLKQGQAIRGPFTIEAKITSSSQHWPIKRVEFFIDRKPYSYSLNKPYLLDTQELWHSHRLPAGEHILRIAAYSRRGPAFAETCSLLEVRFVVRK